MPYLLCWIRLRDQITELRHPCEQDDIVLRRFKVKIKTQVIVTFECSLGE